ncbi:MAG: hypothetical protein HDQ97_17250 [Lachnospiraceae bacterium]|nr:hypothetical protein [Lachnospiraceae bacterium]
MLNDKQKNKIIKLLLYLQENNLYYKKILERMGYEINLENIEQIYFELPYMSKKDIINAGEDFFSIIKENEKINSFITSGSTGQVLECKKTKSESSILALKIWQCRRKVDSLLTPDNYISLFSDDIEDIIGHFYDTNKEVLKKNFEKIMQLNPRWISGPISIIEKFAMMIANKELNYHSSNLKYIEFMGEYVNEKKRKFIENCFDCKTVVHYGLQEVWCVAYDCGDRKLKIFDNDFFCEVINESNNLGEIVITSFNNYYMPIIKYKSGDIGTISYPYKDEKTSILKISDGRIGTEIYGKNILGSYFFDQIIWDVNTYCQNAIFSFKVIQTHPDFFEFYIVKNDSFNSEVLKIIENRMKKELGADIHVKFIFQNNQMFGKNGKTKKFISYLPKEEIG